MNLRFDKRTAIIAAILIVVIAAAVFGMTLTNGWESDSETKEARENAQEERLQQACASQPTYGRLKQLIFDAAVRIRGEDTAALDELATASVVRMERPVVKSRDEELNVTVCTGRFILELPPGAENAFDGERRLEAEIEYAAQAAADGSGLVYSMQGAEPIIYRLATIGGVAPGLVGEPQQPQPVPVPGYPVPGGSDEEVDALPEASPPPPEPAPAPREEPEPRQPAPRTRANPSFDCADAGTRSERMVCGSPGLAALDRRMSSLFYSALADADGETRAELRRSRDRFLAYRERCGSEACVAQAYRDRMDEIRDIVRGR